MTPDLNKFVDVAASGARRMLEEFGEVKPHWVIEDSEGAIHIIHTIWEEEWQKDLGRSIIAEFLEEFKCVRYAFISEAWMTTWAPGDGPIPRASTSKDRQEIITITGEERGGAEVMQRIKITRLDDGVRLGEIENVPGMAAGGRFTNMFKRKES